MTQRDHSVIVHVNSRPETPHIELLLTIESQAALIASLAKRQNNHQMKRILLT